MKGLITRAVVSTGPGKFEICEFPVPEIGPDEGILRLEICGICGSDIAQYDGLAENWGLTRGPTIPGHEPLGIIQAIGDRAARKWQVSVGDRVAVEPLIQCGECEACRSGQNTKCSGWDRVSSYGMLGIDVTPAIYGGYSEYMYLHPNTRLHRMSRYLPPTLAVLFNPLGAGFRWAYSEPDLKVGDTIVILGCGQRGLMSVIAARSAGAGQIIVTDVAAAASKLELARVLGADACVIADEENVHERITELTRGRLADVVVDVSPADGAFADAIQVARRGGVIVLAGSKDGRTAPNVSADQIALKSLVIRGVMSVDSVSYRRAVNFLEGAQGDSLGKFHTASYGLSEAEDAILHLAGRSDRPPAIHVGISPWLSRDQTAQ